MLVVVINIKRLFMRFLLLAVAIIFFAGVAYSAPTQSSELAAKICDIRQMFCGGGGLAVATFSIGVLGFMAFSGRMHWIVALVAVAGITIFMGADQLVGDLAGDESTIDDNCECL